MRSKTRGPMICCLAAGLFGAFVAARRAAPAPAPAAGSAQAAGALDIIRERRPACLRMMKTFCQELYSPQNQGRLTFALGTAPLEIRRGQTENNFSHAYSAYARTQIQYRERLPEDFRGVLGQRDYFDKLERFLQRKAYRGMTVQDRADSTRLAHELEALWQSALDETVLRRTEAAYPGYSRLPADLVPTELAQEAVRIRRGLRAEIANAFWADHPNWRRVVAQFEEVRKGYLDLLRTRAGLDEETRGEWLRRLSSTRLIVPGSDPEVPMVSCATTEENAYYFPCKNYLTVCAGDFNAEDMRLTLAHELGHALDVERSITLFEQGSALGRRLSLLRDRLCTTGPYPCAEWTDLKEHFSSYVQGLEGFRPRLPAFQRCLKGKETRPAGDDYLRRVAREEVQDGLSGLAERAVFLRSITPWLPMPDGTRHRNPMYRNPCGYFVWNRSLDPFDEELRLLLFFTAEYQCGGAAGSQRARFQRAIDTARTLQTELVYARIKMEGDLSGRERLSHDGYAASPTERFADALAAEVFARLLGREPDLPRRRALYLANSAWLCRRPSLQDLYPEEAGVEKQLYADPHSELGVRQQELLSAPIRDALQCEADFQPERECRL